MKLSLNWLKEYVDVSVSPEELADRLMLSGTAVESIEYRGEGIKNVVVGRILNIEKHPNADRLSIAKVNVGVKTIQVVFGDKAVIHEGDRVPVAVAPASIPQGEIKATTFRGVASEGMLCLNSELQSDLSPILTYFSEETPIGQPVPEALGWNDVVFDLSITPNRGDCLSVLGIAREVAAIFTKGCLKTQVGTVMYPIVNAHNDFVHIAVENPLLCPKFCALYMGNVRVAKSPQWLVRRLESVGVRSISNVVDITNYTMLDLGQPLHAFDAAKVTNRSIITRLAKDGEQIVTLDGKERVLDSTMLVLADSKGALDVAGVMGGKTSEVTEKTTDIVLVGCVFDPSSIRRTYRQLGLRTEASIRFEKGIDANLREYSIEKTAMMIKEVAGGETAGGIVRVSEKNADKITVEVKAHYLNTILGHTFTKNVVKDTLKSLGMEISARTKSVFSVTIPSWRHDLTIPADIAEEVGRMYDYNKLTPTPITGAITPPRQNLSFEGKQTIRALLASAGYNEVYTYSYYGEREAEFTGGKSRHAEIANPMSPDEQYLRRSLIPLLLKKASSNLRLFDEIKIFELGSVFEPDARFPKETVMLAGVVSYKKESLYELYRRIKGDLEHLRKGLGIPALSYVKENKDIVICLPGVKLGWIRAVTPEKVSEYKFRQNAAMFECNFSSLLSNASSKRRFNPIQEYPSITRDISFIVPDAARYQDILEIVKKSSPLARETGLADEFRLPDGRRSITLRIVYASPQKTLIGGEVDTVETGLIASLKNKLSFELRK
ncbi:MAG: phenylalanine--tRNA ligase subunit beta [Candidatus Jacksonbacteria bacterium]|nr:phenylalanine--tRNA ligase subunit beta [Candidatus Jacksonbacteria bacterium]